jgi:ATP-binding cassette, subfamily B (MDR/TAP), member 1
LANLIPNIQSFAEASGSGALIFEIIKRESKIDIFRNQGDIPTKLTGDIEFKNVHFTYPSRTESPVRTHGFLLHSAIFPTN